MLTGARVGIIGGGVAGLTLALACAARGGQAVVFERAAAFGDVGAGVQISANGVRVLHALGLHPLEDLAINRPDFLHISDLSTGIRLMSARQNGKGRGSHLHVHRADLVGWLARRAEAAGVEVRPGQEVAPGDLQGFDHVALASGVRSAARPGPPPVFTGQVAWRALVPSGAAPGLAGGDTHVFIAPRRHLVIYPLRDRSLLNLVAVEDGRTWDRQGWDHPGDPDHLRAAFHPAPAAVTGLLAAIGEVRRWALYTHPEVAMQDAAGLPLIGDAAQAMLPFMAQGAVMAMEDAYTLAAAWDGGDLDAWARSRAARRTAVSRTAQANGRIFHESRGWWLPFHRAGMWGLGRIWPGLIERRARWIYDHDVTAGG